MKRTPQSRWIWHGLIAIQFASLTWLSTLGEIRVIPLWIGYGAAFTAYLLALVVLRKERISLYVVFLAALALRLPWIPAGLSLSDDAWRYLHDGRSQVAGINPYRYPPSAPEARAYAGPEHPLINNAELPTIYPPAAQLAFRAAVHLGGTLVSWKLLLMMGDLAVGIGLAMLLTSRGRDPALAAVYLLHPLPVMEFAGNGHLDALGICALVFSLAFLRRRSPLLSGVSLAVSGAVKYLALPLAPFFFRYAKRGAGTVAIGLVVTLVVLYMPFWGVAPIGSLGTFARTFEFNGPVYLLANELAGQVGARVLLVSILFGLMIFFWVRDAEVDGAAMIWISALLLFSPIVHPWYVTWLIPFLAWREEWWAMAWSGTIVLSYYVLTDWRAEGVWHLPWLVMLVEYLPVYVLLGRQLMKQARTLVPA